MQITPSVVDFRGIFPHVYDRINQEFPGWRVDAVEYRYTAWKQEHFIGVTLSDGQSRIVMNQFRSPYYAGGFSHVSVRKEGI